ncbi:hypothetical protein HOI71_08090 [Candidatus Poribacteria bacterium]|nr:hypothetical protein [Candidatus Poribacteria bacterium]
MLLGLRVIESATTVDDAIRQSRELRGVTSGTLEDVRRIAFDMRPSSLDDLGLETTLRRDLEPLSQNTGVGATFRATNPTGTSLPSETDEAIYRIVHTALTNIVHHADARYADLVVDTRSVGHGECCASVVVQDRGVGFDVDAVLDGSVEGPSPRSPLRPGRPASCVRSSVDVARMPVGSRPSRSWNPPIALTVHESRC